MLDRPSIDALLDRLRLPDERSYALAELNDLLTELSNVELWASLEELDLSGLSPLDQNYVAAMVELAAARHGVQPPAWTSDVAPLETPHFTSPLPGLRLHLLRESPVPFKRRNIFIDSSLGGRV